MACGLLGIRQKIRCRTARQCLRSATLGNAITALENSTDLAEILGAEFVARYCAHSKVENEELNRIVTPWALQNFLK
ncbi:hypothetical protein [Craterilacuibacter sp.]|uniref:hypothetical protein n=1 Tax=Craterilacuibacter sp. TaxID=2870909 RepID=UPI003F39EF57